MKRKYLQKKNEKKIEKKIGDHLRKKKKKSKKKIEFISFFFEKIYRGLAFLIMFL